MLAKCPVLDETGSYEGAHGRGRGGQEDEAAEVGSALVGQSAGCVEQGTNTVTLQGRSDSLCRWSAGFFGQGNNRGLCSRLCPRRQRRRWPPWTG